MLGLPPNASGLADLRKSDPRKVQLAILLRIHTTVSNAWIAVQLVMSHLGSVSRSVSVGRSRKELQQSIKEVEMMLIRVLTPFTRRPQPTDVCLILANR